MKNYLAIILLLGSVGLTHAQDSTASHSRIRLIQDARLVQLEKNANKLSEKNFKQNTETTVEQSNQAVRGYRIQIYSGNDRNYANDVRLKFMTSYPQTACYIQFLSPYFKVRVGDYTSSAEANKQLKYFKRVYPSAFVISAYVNP